MCDVTFLPDPLPHPQNDVTVTILVPPPPLRRAVIFERPLGLSSLLHIIALKQIRTQTIASEPSDSIP